MKLVHHTTICIVPPETSWSSLSDIRLKLQDKGFYRWPPHVNLIYPCIPQSQLESVLPQLAESLRSIEPFEINLTEFGVFGGKSRGVLYLKPECEKNNLNDLYFAIDSVIRNHCDSYHENDIIEKDHDNNNIEKDHDNNNIEKDGYDMKIIKAKKNKKNDNDKAIYKSKPFVPHLTVCHFPSVDEALKASEQFLPFKNLKFKLDRVYALTRPSNDPENVGQFGVAYTLLLGNRSTIPIYENNKKFQSMPKQKFQWIIDAEKKYKKTSKWNKKKRRNKSKSDNKSDISDESVPDKKIEKFDFICKVLSYFKNLIPSADELWL